MIQQWRENLAQIRESITGNPGTHWRDNITAIARFRGHEPSGWREAIRLLAADHGVFILGWRGQLSGIVKALGGDGGTGWRLCASFIKDYYEAPTIPHRIRSADGYLLRDANNNILLVRR